ARGSRIAFCSRAAASARTPSAAWRRWSRPTTGSRSPRSISSCAAPASSSARASPGCLSFAWPISCVTPPFWRRRGARRRRSSPRIPISGSRRTAVCARLCSPAGAASSTSPAWGDVADHRRRLQRPSPGHAARRDDAADRRPGAHRAARYADAVAVGGARPGPFRGRGRRGPGGALARRGARHLRRARRAGGAGVAHQREHPGRGARGARRARRRAARAARAVARGRTLRRRVSGPTLRRQRRDGDARGARRRRAARGRRRGGRTASHEARAVAVRGGARGVSSASLRRDDTDVLPSRGVGRQRADRGDGPRRRVRRRRARLHEPRTLVDEFAACASRFGPSARREKLRLLARLASTPITSVPILGRLHEILCFVRAYPDDARVQGAAEHALRDFAARVRRLRPAARARLHDSGIAETDLDYPFGLPMTRWLAARFPGDVTIAWPKFHGGVRLEEALCLLVTPTESEAL